MEQIKPIQQMEHAAGLEALRALLIVLRAAVGSHPQKSDQSQEYDSNKNQIFHPLSFLQSFCRV
jgi:hypothetical protein